MPGPWPRLSARRLLALVFLSPQRRISREVACDTLFRDLGSRAAAGALYNAVSSARGVLTALGEPAAAVLGTGRAGIYIPPTAAVEVDLDLHEEALGAALRMEPGSTRDEALARPCRSKASCWRTNCTRTGRYAAVTALSYHGRLPASPWLGTVPWATAARGPKVSLSPGRPCFPTILPAEEAAAALMGAYASRGERQLAVRTYNRCRAGLEELGLEPSPALARAYRSATQEAGDLVWPGSAHAPHLSTNLPTPPSSFIGRKAEQADSFFARYLVGARDCHGARRVR